MEWGWGLGALRRCPCTGLGGWGVGKGLGNEVVGGGSALRAVARARAYPERMVSVSLV